MSKELKALENIKGYFPFKRNELEYQNIDIIETAIKNYLKILPEHEDITKKLKALEIIKQVIPIEEEDFFYDKETNTYFFIGNKVSKEQFDLLKEALE